MNSDKFVSAFMRSFWIRLAVASFFAAIIAANLTYSILTVFIAACTAPLFGYFCRIHPTENRYRAVFGLHLLLMSLAILNYIQAHLVLALLYGAMGSFIVSAIRAKLLSFTAIDYFKD